MTETKSLAEALAVLMTKLPRIEKANEAKVPTKAGGSYSYNYADLAQVSEAILPILGGLGLSFTAKPTMSGGQFVLAYRLLHVSGEDDKGEYPLPTGGTPQSQGSAITYARRYCLCAVTGVAPKDDDDGAAAEAEARRPVAQPEPQWERPTPDPVTDPAWLERMEKSITGASTAEALEAVAVTIRNEDQAGRVSKVHGQHLFHLYQQRQGELAGQGAS